MVCALVCLGFSVPNSVSSDVCHCVAHTMSLSRASCSHYLGASQEVPPPQLPISTVPLLECIQLALPQIPSHIFSHSGICQPLCALQCSSSHRLCATSAKGNDKTSKCLLSISSFHGNHGKMFLFPHFRNAIHLLSSHSSFPFRRTQCLPSYFPKDGALWQRLSAACTSRADAGVSAGQLGNITLVLTPQIPSRSRLKRQWSRQDHTGSWCLPGWLSSWLHILGSIT